MTLVLVEQLESAEKTLCTFSHSWKKRRELASAQEELHLPQHSLVTDCATRWGSLQKMVERVLEQEKAIRKVLGSNQKTTHLIPTCTWQDISVLESIQAALGPLADFTDIMSAEDSVTLSALVPVMHLFRTKLLAESDEDTELTKSIKTHALRYLEDKYAEPSSSELLKVCSHCKLDSN